MANDAKASMTISDIPTETFHQIIRDLCSDGWKKTQEYDGIDAWIDYGMIVLRKRFTCLKFEWTNWEEGSIGGPSRVIQGIKDKYSLR